MRLFRRVCAVMLASGLLALLMTAPAGATPALTCGQTVSGTVVLHGNLNCPGATALRVETNNTVINLHGLTITGTIVTGQSLQGLVVENGTLNGTLNGDLFVGEAPSGLQVTLNYMVLLQQINMFGSGGMIVENSLVKNGGFLLFGATGDTFRRNRWLNAGISLNTTVNITIVGNTFLRDGGVTYAFDSGCGCESPINGLTVSGNYFGHADSGLIGVGGGTGVNVTNNVFDSNVVGMATTYSTGFKGGLGVGGISGNITGNVFANNRVAGLYIQGGGKGTVAGNVFYGNGFHTDPAFMFPVGATFGRPLNPTVKDGMFVDPVAPASSFFGNPIPAHPQDTSGIVVKNNYSIRNAGFGFNDAGVTDGGGNRASLNGNRAQCLGVVCHP